jgi:hypothetical protein
MWSFSFALVSDQSLIGSGVSSALQLTTVRTTPTAATAYKAAANVP